jgi:uncharacterized membrane protein AbrB (regulator of aidB expression)
MIVFSFVVLIAMAIAINTTNINIPTLYGYIFIGIMWVVCMVGILGLAKYFINKRNSS